MELNKDNSHEPESAADFENKNAQNENTNPAGCSDDSDFSNEKEWADILGMNFDPEEAKRNQTPPPYQDYSAPGYHDDGMQPLMPPLNQIPVPDSTEVMPPTYLVWAILSTICCCLPAGIVAIVFSASVSSRFYARDFEGARRASRRAEIWIIVAIVAGIIANSLYIPLSLLLPS